MIDFTSLYADALRLNIAFCAIGIITGFLLAKYFSPSWLLYGVTCVGSIWWIRSYDIELDFGTNFETDPDPISVFMKTLARARLARSVALDPTLAFMRTLLRLAPPVALLGTMLMSHFMCSKAPDK